MSSNDEQKKNWSSFEKTPSFTSSFKDENKTKETFLRPFVFLQKKKSKICWMILEMVCDGGNPFHFKTKLAKLKRKCKTYFEQKTHKTRKEAMFAFLFSTKKTTKQLNKTWRNTHVCWKRRHPWPDLALHDPLCLWEDEGTSVRTLRDEWKTVMALGDLFLGLWSSFAKENKT